MSNGRRHITPTHRIGRHIAAVVITLIALAACHYLPPFGGIRGGLLGRLGGVDSLINSRPDSALTLLNSIARDTAEMSRRDLMRYYLLRTNAENKCDTVLTARHAALMRRVCDYYDRHSSKREANNRMLAHYLLGRCYSDMGEAPAALQEFHNAVEVADTISTDCDFACLLRVFQQTGYLFARQFMPHEAIAEYQKAYKTALSLHDTLAAIGSYELQANPYFILGENDSVMKICQTAAEQYRRMGLMKRSARALSPAVYLLMRKGRMKEAEKALGFYERYADLYDSQGRLKRSNALIYAFKGEYFLHRQVLDSARWYFYKDIQESDNINNRIHSYSGLSRLYHLIHQNDSAYKYASLCTHYTDSFYLGRMTQQMSQVQALYNYERSQNAAENAARKAKAARQLSILLTCLLVTATIVSIFIFRARRKSSKMKQRIIHGQQTLLLTNLSYVKADMQNMQRRNDTLQQQIALLQGEKDSDTLLTEKILAERNVNEQRIHELEKTKAQLERKLEDLNNNKGSNLDILSDNIVHSSTIAYLHKLAKQGKPATAAEWANLNHQVDDALPNFKPLIQTLYPTIDDRKILVCILIKLRFKLSEIALLLNISSQVLSNDRRQMNEKMFSAENTVKNFDERIRNLGT